MGSATACGALLIRYVAPIAVAIVLLNAIGLLKLIGLD